MSAALPASTLSVDVVVPAYNEAGVLSTTIERLHDHLGTHHDHPWTITIAENASTDATAAIADDLATSLPHVRVLHVPEPGRGRALRTAWTTSDADVVAYMDADLSTDLAALGPLVDAVASKPATVAIGSRLVTGAVVDRRLGREAISRAYNALVRAVLRATFHDAQCGFKALRRTDALALLPRVLDDGWFFDTELLLVAQRSGLVIEEVPVHWVDDPDSSVRIVSTAIADLRGVARMAWARPRSR